MQVVKRNAMLELQNVVMNENGRNYRNDNFHFPVGFCLNRFGSDHTYIHTYLCVVRALCIFIEATKKIDQIHKLHKLHTVNLLMCSYFILMSEC